MQSEKFTTTSMSISAILGLIKANDIAIPEIQRPFVWKSKQVRDLIDSLYRGFPVGYIILWKNPNVKLKDGTISSGKKVLIDLKNLTFMDSTGIGVLLGRYKRLAEKGVRVYLSSPTPAVDRILKLSGIYQLMSKIER